jgi:hypothetical protein
MSDPDSGVGMDAIALGSWLVGPSEVEERLKSEPQNVEYRISNFEGKTHGN